MKKSLTEMLGFVGGYFLGVLTASVSFLRQSRVFHPQGQTFLVEVDSLRPEVLRLHPYALMRLSSAIWKKKEWRDTLGLALRFSAGPSFYPLPRGTDQDLLFATFDSSWKIFWSPLITRYHDYLANEYFSISPFATCNSHESYFKLVPFGKVFSTGSREDKIREAVRSGQGRFILMIRGKNKEWIDIAELTMKKEISLDQEALRFNPFQTGLGIRPIGFIQYLRMGAYRMSQMARPKRTVPRYSHQPLWWPILSRKYVGNNPEMVQTRVVKQGGFMQVSEVMSKGIVSANIDDSIKKVAEMMKQEDVGALPVLEDNKPVGFITDRDIVVSCIAEGDDLQQPIRKAMTKDVFSVTEDQDVQEASRLMQQHQVSRVLVMDKQRQPVGMVSLKDLSQEDEDLSAETVSQIKRQ